MPAELILANGPSAGTRFALGAGETLIGRAPNSSLVLPEAEVGWRHCSIAPRGGRYSLTDLRSSAGTFVNGTRSAERWLEDRDQIGIGKTIIVFRSGASEVAPQSEPTSEAKPLLLAACSLVFLFRAVAASAGASQTRLLKRQVIRIVADLMPAADAFLALGGSAPELVKDLQNDGLETNGFEPLLQRLNSDGACIDPELKCIAVPLYTNGRLTGGIVVQLKDSEIGALAVHLETLTAIASLASMAFEANHEVEMLKAENALLQEQIPSTSGIVGGSPAIKRLLDLVERVAPRDTTVLITGESGTGKELIARALHEKSARRGHPFVAVNCAALSESLFESELFGHEKGAFTGAIAQKRGRFELAQGGTIFLDEVGELASPLQAKLLRVLQQREFERVGGTQVLSLDIRVIAATNRDLTLDVREGKFREDLYHRLNVVCLQSPALRDRKEDIPVLARFFLNRYSQRCKRQMQGVTAEAEEMLVQYSWPGNVRELENSMERAVVLGVSDWVLPEDLPENLLEAVPESAGARYHSSVGQAKREAILDAYAQGNGDYKQAAKILGLHPNYLLRLVRNLSLRDEIHRAVATGGH